MPATSYLLKLFWFDVEQKHSMALVDCLIPEFLFFGQTNAPGLHEV